MRTLCCALALLLPACLEYEITVTTSVQADGTVRRAITIRARDERKPADAWKRFKAPGGPYALEGDREKGFVATATLQPGLHPGGLRVLLGDPDEVKDCPSAEGTVEIRATDLLVGTLYRYEERIALGTDPARFRDEVPRWLDTGLRLVVEALRLRFPDTDFAPVEARARAELLPALQAAIVNIHHAGTAMFLELSSLKADLSLAALARSEFWPAVVREFAAFGVRLPSDEAGLKALEKDDEASERLFREVQANLADRLLAPLPEAQRAPAREALLAEEGLEHESELAREKVAVDEDEFAAFLARGLGAFVVYGLFDSFDLRFRLELPGKPLRTNGELSSLPAVTWRLGKDGELLLVPPLLHACSFVPVRGVAAEGWDLVTLTGIEGALLGLEPEARAAVAMVVAAGIAGGTWDDAGLSGESQAACRVIREALEAAKAR